MSDCWDKLKVFFGIDVIITSCVGMLCMKRANIELRLISKGLWLYSYNDHYTRIQFFKEGR